MEVMGEPQHHMRWTGTTDTLGFARELRRARRVLVRLVRLSSDW